MPALRIFGEFLKVRGERRSMAHAVDGTGDVSCREDRVPQIETRHGRCEAQGARGAGARHGANLTGSQDSIRGRARRYTSNLLNDARRFSGETSVT